MTLISRLVFFERKKTLQKSSEKVVTNEISIVIPVRDNQEGVNSYLDSFFITHQPGNFPREIIFVDNNSVAPLFIPEKHKNSGLSLKLFQCKKKGPASARNFGANHAAGKWILFNDSDCLPTESLISGYLKADNGAVAYAGNIKALGIDKLSRYYESQEILIPLKTFHSSDTFVPQYIITANTLVWREAFVECGGFNEQISIAGGEDVDLGLRLSQIGELSYAFDSIAYHNFNDGFIGFYKRFKRYGKGNRIIEHLWGTNMRPKPFKPISVTSFNRLAALFQYLFLYIGYFNANYQIKKYGLVKTI